MYNKKCLCCGKTFKCQTLNRKFCSLKCSTTGKFNPNYGKIGANTGKKFSDEHRKKIGFSLFGRKFTEEHKKHLREASCKVRPWVSEQCKKWIGNKNPNWKGGMSRCIDCNCLIPHKNYKVKRCRKCWFLWKKSLAKPKKNCILCGKELSRPEYDRFCKKCFSIPENTPNWKGGRSFEPYPIGWNKTYREQIRYRDGYKCQLCGKPEVENDRKLHVHHKDYDKKNIKETNLVSLCTSCHMKTGWNREVWIEFFGARNSNERI